MSDGKKGRPENAWMGIKRGERAALILRGLILKPDSTTAEPTRQIDWVSFFLERFTLVSDPNILKAAPKVTSFFREVVANLEQLSEAESPEIDKLNWTRTTELLGVPELLSLLHASQSYIDELALETFEDSYVDGYWHPHFGENCASAVREELLFSQSFWQAYDDESVLHLIDDESFRQTMLRIQEESWALSYLSKTEGANIRQISPSELFHQVRTLNALVTEFQTKFVKPLMERRKVVYLSDKIDNTQLRQINQFVLKKRSGLTYHALAVRLKVSEDETENSGRRVNKFLHDLMSHNAFELSNLSRGNYQSFLIAMYQLRLLNCVSHLRKKLTQ